jgi:type II secretory pathway component PulK
MTHHRLGLILPTVLLVLALLAMLALSFAFAMRASVSATSVSRATISARLAAEAGVQRAISLLRTDMANIGAWYDNPENFKRQRVWVSDEGVQTSFDMDTKKLDPDVQAWLFSVVADDPTDDVTRFRYGLTDEASRLNLNTASRYELATLFGLLIADAEINPQELADAVIDWRDSDDTPEPLGAESSYYESLPTPYQCKNARFETVEELLMVRGFTGQVVYGEDYNRNGLLDPNEDDGEETFPPDNADGRLNRGLLPYLTVWSVEPNQSNDLTARVNLLGRDEEAMRRALDNQGFDESTIDYLMSVRGRISRSPAELLSLAEQGEPVPDSLRDLATVMDKLTTLPTPYIEGPINVNTASPQVLQSLEALTLEEADSIVSTRANLDAFEKSTLAWLYTQGVVSLDRFIELTSMSDGEFGIIIPRLTARSFQYHVESIGFASHIGVTQRLEVVLWMQGHQGQIVYYRDLSELGTRFPRLRSDDEDLRVR